MIMRRDCECVFSQISDPLNMLGTLMRLTHNMLGLKHTQQSSLEPSQARLVAISYLETQLSLCPYRRVFEPAPRHPRHPWPHQDQQALSLDYISLDKINMVAACSSSVTGYSLGGGTSSSYGRCGTPELSEIILGTSTRRSFTFHHHHRGMWFVR